MLVDGELDPNNKLLLMNYLDKNNKFLNKIVKIEYNGPPVYVKYLEENEFNVIWPPNERPRNEFCMSFLKQFENEFSCYGEPIVAFVSDLDFYETKKKDINNKIIFPGIYVKNKRYDDPNLNFGILYCLIRAQIYYSISRSAILKKYEGIDSVLYSAMALQVMDQSDFETLMHHQRTSIKLGGNWAIPIFLNLIGGYSKQKRYLDEILDGNLIKKLIFGADIDEFGWIDENRDLTV